MSDYTTMNPVPSIDPRDLDDNAKAFDRFLQSDAASEPDRLGVQRKTWHQMELDAAALVSPNVAALAAVAPAVDKAFFFNSTSPVGMGSYTLNSFNRSLGATADGPAFRAAIGAIGAADNITGSAAKITTPRNIALTGDGSWNVNFDGSAGATATFTLATSGVTAGTYDRVTVDAKGRATAGVSKIAWTSYTPTVTATTGTYTSASAIGEYMVHGGICHWQARITITTKGTGVRPIITLPQAARAGSNDKPIPAKEVLINGKIGAAKILVGLTTAVLEDYAAADLVTADGCVININGSYPIA